MTDHEDIRHKEIEQDLETFSFTETAGQKLAAARKDRDISVQEVAENLNLRVSIVEAVEADEYDKLPGSTFTRGYIRAYANLLRLDPDELIAMLGVNPVQMMEIPSGDGTSRIRRKPWRANKKRGFLLKFLIFVIALAFIALALLGLNHWLQLDLEKFVSQYQLLMSESTESGLEGNGN